MLVGGLLVALFVLPDVPSLLCSLCCSLLLLYCPFFISYWHFYVYKGNELYIYIEMLVGGLLVALTALPHSLLMCCLCCVAFAILYSGITSDVNEYGHNSQR